MTKTEEQITENLMHVINPKVAKAPCTACGALHRVGVDPVANIQRILPHLNWGGCNSCGHAMVAVDGKRFRDLTQAEAKEIGENLKFAEFVERRERVVWSMIG